ncbi:MAG: hormogonium polysaccharide biosynthesis protein HpsA [Nodosilinea sp.]
MHHLLQQVWRLPQAALKRLVAGLLQIVLLANRPARLARSGFVLPTTVLLVLMVVLTATALTYRSFSRSEQAIIQREQRVIANAATPAIDRAKAKLEFMFQQDPRFPSGLPASDILADLMAGNLDPTKNFVGYTGRVSPINPSDKFYDPYTLPDEQRLDLNNDGKLDNAWSFPSEGKTIVYSVLVDDSVDIKEASAPGTGENFLPRAYVKKSITLDTPTSQEKADALITRTGPLATTEATPQCKGALAEGGWQLVTRGNNSDLQKNFQINAFVANNNDANSVNRTFETLEFQQSRQASRASKWGAWFRYDLEIFPGPEFNWNGAMHTDGNFITRGDVRYHMISSHNSCLYSQGASEITLAEANLDGIDGINPQSTTASTTGLRDFQGQVIKGATLSDNYSGTDPTVHVFDGDGKRPRTGDKLRNNNDSVTGGRPSDVSMNALTLFTQDQTQHINVNSWSRNPDWDKTTNIFNQGKRLINDEVARPFVDDFFRADDRWGPKPRYDNRTAAFDIANQPATTTIGDKINGLVGLTNPADGLDGYWERRSSQAGLRMIIGQRLELGNSSGWNLDPTTGTLSASNDPLYPAIQRKGALTTNDFIGPSEGNHEYLQRRSLRDNLAAVQGMVVYHYEINDGQFPAACMALTAHPGTRQSIVDSRTFENYPNKTNLLRADFLTGKGTNGWEFQFPTGSTGFSNETTFASSVAASEPLGIALRNLAYFAGDPSGGAPSFKPVQDGNIHPAPYLNMWGDFSPLRRIFVEYLDATPAVKYADLSLADKATLHSAACTVSLLAYNLKSDYEDARALLGAEKSRFQNISTQLRNGMANIIEYVEDNKDSGGKMAALFSKLGKVRAWTDTNISNVPCISGNDTAGFQSTCDVGEYFAEFTLSDWRIIIDEVTNATTAELDEIVDFGNSITYIASTIRDRDLGFRQGATKRQLGIADPSKNVVGWNNTTQYTEAVRIPVSGSNKDFAFQTKCNPNLFTDVIAKGTGGKDDQVALTLVACSNYNAMQVKYPSLFYLFPLVDHNLKGTGDYAQPDGVAIPPATQAAEEYITNAYVNTTNPTTLNFKVVRAASTVDPVEGLSVIAAVPRAATASTWTVPAANSSGLLAKATVDNLADAFKINAPTGVVIKVPFLDKGVFNGREQLNTRVLDVDIEAITTRQVGTGDYWLPANREKQAEGVFFAFREDAVREDSIVRPANTAATNCEGIDTGTLNPRRFRIETQAACRMQVRPGDTTTASQDPPLTARRISIKPVDFIADPERRTHGFRLRTASGNPTDFSGTSFARQVGMTLVTDNSVYIQGDFNLHSTSGQRAGIVEEFTQTIYNKTLANAFGNKFYDDRTTLNTDTFANLAKDHWRPVEILSDAIVVLSSNFVDGAVEDTFIEARPASKGGTAIRTSYMNQNRPILASDLALDKVLREQPGNNDSPVWVDRNGTYFVIEDPSVLSPPKPFYDEYDADDEWVRFDSGEDDRRRNIPTANETFINAVFVSGIGPKRPNQSYGGLHNYPRFLENWENTSLHIAGSFIQLNFSTTATGPFEHDAWEVGATPNADQRLGYYDPPDRRWGYDVGLLYVPPAPAARRFVTIGAPRSEYYREVAADDPYILNLRCAKNADGDRILSGNLCPKAS